MIVMYGEEFLVFIYKINFIKEFYLSLCMGQRLLHLVKNKFLIVSLAFVVWMLFFDRNDLTSQLHYKKQKANLEKQKDFYNKEIAEIEKNLEELSSDPVKLEKFAREKYLMKKENEDLFIIVEEEDIQ